MKESHYYVSIAIFVVVVMTLILEVIDHFK